MPDYQKLRQEAIALREQGYSMRQIGQRLGLQSGTITRWVSHVPFDGFNEATRTAQRDAYRDPALYQQAIDLRKQGYSYRLITEATGVSKSTLSGWLKDVPFAEHHPDVRARVENAVQVMGQAQRTKAARLKSEAEAEAAEEMATLLATGISERELFLMGLTLYWAEGSKTQGNIRMTNADPFAIRLFMKWAEKFLGTKVDQFRVHIYTHPDVSEQAALDYWIEQTGVSQAQFYKTTVDERTKTTNKVGKLQYGTLSIRINGKGTKYLHQKILFWIEHVSSYINTMRV